MKPIATRYTKRKGFGWDVWAMEPDGVWVWLGNTWTKRGAKRMLRVFLTIIDMEE